MTFPSFCYTQICYTFFAIAKSEGQEHDDKMAGPKVEEEHGVLWEGTDAAVPPRSGEREDSEGLAAREIPLAVRSVPVNYHPLPVMKIRSITILGTQNTLIKRDTCCQLNQSNLTRARFKT